MRVFKIIQLSDKSYLERHPKYETLLAEVEKRFAEKILKGTNEIDTLRYVISDIARENHRERNTIINDLGGYDAMESLLKTLSSKTTLLKPST